MIEDMTVRGFTPGTQRGYDRGGQEFHRLSWSLAGLRAEIALRHLRRYQLHMKVMRGVGDLDERRRVVDALRFFFGVTLHSRNDANAGMTTVREPMTSYPSCSVRKRSNVFWIAAPEGSQYRAAR